MQSSNRIIVNTVAQYTRTFINIILSLYSSRLILMMLGESDFGIYSLIAGIVALLSFITNSMVMSTQRFLSIAQGKGDIDDLKRIFNNGLILHLIVGVVIVLCFSVLTPFLFNGFFNIPTDRIEAARILYFIVIGVLFTSFQTSPYRALLVSHENIVYISIIDIIDGILKLVLVFIIPYSTIDSLITYGFIVLGIQLFNFLAFSIYGHLHYQECVYVNISNFSKDYASQLCRFIGWVTFSNFCLVGRNQGFAIVINKLLEITANTAYGIANQLSGYLSFLTSSFATAVSPQLIQAVGKGDYGKAISLAKFQSKIGYLMFGLIAIPFIFEIDGILTIWLKEYPVYTPTFAIMIIASSLVDQPTYGLTTVFQALGKLAFFTIVFYLPKFLVLPISWLILKNGCSLIYVAIAYFTIEAICMLMRMVLLKKEMASFSIMSYMKDVHLRVIVPSVFSIILCAISINYIDTDFRVIITFISSGFIYILTSYFFSLTDIEKSKVVDVLNIIISKR